jgi:hypothetical protein
MLEATAAATAATTKGLLWRTNLRNRVDIAAVALLVRDIY